MPLTTDTHIAIIGGSGFIGSAIVREAHKRGIRVSALSAPRLRWEGPFDIKALPSVEESTVSLLASQIAGHTVVINAAGISDATSGDEEGLFGANALLPVAIARAAARAGVDRYIHVSSAAVQGRGQLDETPRVSPFSPYSRSKALAEIWLEKEEFQAVILRPTSVQGTDRPVTKLVARLAASPFSSYVRPSRPTQQTHVDTVAKAVLALASPEVSPPSIVLSPDEGMTTEAFLHLLGDRRPKRLPTIVGRLALFALTVAGVAHPRLAAYSRRLEVLWFGQDRTPGWFDAQPSTAKLLPDESAWRALGTQRPRAQRQPLVLFGVTSGVSVRGFFAGQHAYLRSHGWDVHLACSNEGDPGSFAASEGATYIPINTRREPSPIHDLKTMAALYHILRKLRPDVCVWGSPKLGLLGPLASRLSRTPSIYVIHGLRLETTTGVLRAGLKLSEAIACAAATQVVVVGHELHERVLSLRLASSKKLRVLANGSANGIADPGEPNFKAPQTQLVGFVGRITADKGLQDLADAWPQVLKEHPAATLIIVGRAESDRESEALAKRLRSLPRTEWCGHVQDLSTIYRTLAVLVLPSYREGLPNVILEAASHGIPSITTTATGASEPVVDGVTGMVVPTGAPQQLGSAIKHLLDNAALRSTMGLSARTYVLERYAQGPLWEAWTHILDEVRR